MASTAATASVLGLIVFGTLASLLGKIGKHTRLYLATAGRAITKLIRFIMCASQCMNFRVRTSMVTTSFSGAHVHTHAWLQLWCWASTYSCTETSAQPLFSEISGCYMQEAMGDNHFYVYRHVLLSAYRVGV